MSLTEGYFPVGECRLIADPTTYAGAGGTDMGKVGSAHLASVLYDMEFITEDVSGSTPTEARATGVKANYLVHLIDYKAKLVELLSNKTNSSQNWQGFTSYDLGKFFSASQYRRLLLLPVDRAGAQVVTRPHMYFPKAVCVGGFNPTFDRRLPFTSGFLLSVAGMLHASFSSPVLFGDPATFPAIVV